MDNSGYTAIVAVRKHKATPNAQDRFCICSVPSGQVLNSGDIVFYGAEPHTDYDKGVCVSDSTFADLKTLEMLCTVTSGLPHSIPEIKAKVNVDWFIPANIDCSKEVCI
jgi:hypothetical protein